MCVRARAGVFHRQLRTPWHLSFAGSVSSADELTTSIGNHWPYCFHISHNELVKEKGWSRKSVSQMRLKKIE